MRTRTLSAALAVLLLAPAVAAAQQPQQDRLQLEDYLELEDVRDPQLSPDGSQVIYARRWVDKLNDRWESSLWIVGADGAKNRFLVDGSSPRWSPDGTRIAYLARDDDGKTQVFVRWMDAEGAVSQVTRVTESPSDIRWSPDGEQIAFTMRVPGDEGWRVESQVSKLKPQGATWTKAPRVVEKLDYRADRVGFTASGYDHIFVVPSDGGTPRRLTDGDWDHRGPEWSPDGRTIVFSSLREPEAEYQVRESEVYAVDVASGQVRQLTTRDGPDYGPAVSPDGRWVAYIGYDETDDTYREAELYVMGIDGSGPRSIAREMGRAPDIVEWAEDGSGVYYNADMKGRRNLWFAPVRGEPRPVTDGAHMLSTTDVGPRGLAVGTVSSAQRPDDVVAFDVRSPARLRPLTDVNADILAGVELGEVEEVWYGSKGGLDVQGWIIKPPGFDPSKKYPLILSIHGGPHGMYNTGFNFGWQEHAANGYVVLYTNPRGSAGYGSEFGNAIENAYPGDDYFDLMAGVDTLIARGYIDDQNLFVYGCSGGGVLTSWIVGHTDRFAAASANCPVTNWLSFVGTTDGPYWYYNFEKYPWEDPTEHLRRSPLMYVGNVKTPTMLMTGVNDLRTPISQTEEFYQALKIRKVPTAMVRFNDEWHGTSSKPSNFLRSQLYLRDWFQKHARGKATERPTVSPETGGR